MRSLLAYNLVRLAKWIYPPLLNEMVRMTMDSIIEQGDNA